MPRAAASGPMAVVRSISVSDPAPPPRPEAGSRASGEPGAVAAWAGPVGLVLVAGLTLPPHYGLVLPLLLYAVMVAVGERRLRAVARLRAQWPEGGVRASVRIAGLIGAMSSVAVLLTVLARAVGQLLVEIPAALWGGAAALGAAIAWAVVGARVPRRVRPLLLLGLCAAVPVAGVMGTRFEAEGPNARGLAHSGPILGIHPFQTTAVIIDGHGPFDLPINDYVEPDGGRGYGPEALADALDRALASIAERVYPDGPRRVARAFADAEVEAVYTPAVWERLDREPSEEIQPRFIVRSGSFGRDSRVEFVCPGRRIDPRSNQGESVMNRMCPDKYASEASAGLGVTGRWSGYSERRGNDRAGLFALRGWTRSNDKEGRSVLERETRLWAWITLGLWALGLWTARARMADGLRGVGGMLGAVALVGLVIGCIGRLGEPSVGLWPAGPSWLGPPSLVALAPALALGSLSLFSFDRPPSAAPAREGRIAMPALVVVVSTLALAASLPALSWAQPLRPAEGLRLVPLVQGLAEAIGEPGGLTIFEVEGALASALVAVLLGAGTAVGRAGRAVTVRLGPGSGWGIALALCTALAIAAALVMSRKTHGAAALIPGVIGLTLVLGSTLSRLGAPRSWPRLLVHLAWMALGAALVWAGTAPLPTSPVVTLYTALGLGLVLATGLAGLAGATPPPRTPPPA